MRTYFARKTIKNTGPVKWNSVDNLMKNAKTVTNFRLKIKDNVISNYV